MADTQLPRYMVFQQHEPDEPMVHNGTVHAADPEMALLTARDVFSRRPRAVRMWVVPAEAIFSLTRQELENKQWHISQGGENENYHVFVKTYEQGQCEHIGAVKADSHEAAMQAAVETFADEKVLWWWVFPAAAVSSTLEEDTGSMFDPVLDKRYREQTQYPVITMMRKIRAKGGKQDD